MNRVLLVVVTVVFMVVIGSGCANQAGLDVMLVVDCSFSMQNNSWKSAGEDVLFFDAMKGLGEDIITNRPGDRIGISAFTYQPIEVCELTRDHELVLEKLAGLKMDFGTGAGSALIKAIESMPPGLASKKRVIVLITDNGEKVSATAKETIALAKKEGVRIFTIEITNNRLLEPREIAQHPLYNMSRAVGGQFGQATSDDDLAWFFDVLDKLEKGEE